MKEYRRITSDHDENIRRSIFEEEEMEDEKTDGGGDEVEKPKHGDKRTIDGCDEYYDSSAIQTDENGDPVKDDKGNYKFGKWIEAVPNEKVTVTVDQLKQIFPNSKKETREKVAEIFNQHASQYSITNYLQAAHFFGQAGGETGGLALFKENTNYSVEQAKSMWGKPIYKKDPNTQKDWIDPNTKKKEVEKYEREKFNDETFLKEIETDKTKLMNYVYGNEVHPDLGNTEEGDGAKFIGRGMHQLTGRANYKKFQDSYNKKFDKNIDLMANPDLVDTDWELRVLSALDFYEPKLKTVGNSSNVWMVTTKINGGTNGLDSRFNYTEAAVKAFGLNVKLSKDKPKK